MPRSSIRTRLFGTFERWRNLAGRVTPLIAERLASLVVAHFNLNYSAVFVGWRLTW